MLSTEKIQQTIFTVGLLTSLVMGHMVGTYEVDYPTISYYGYILAALFCMNALTFFGSMLIQFTKLPFKHKLMKAALGLLINIPLAFVYFLILVSYAF